MTDPFIDTSVLVRYLTDDPPELGQRAASYIESGDPFTISALVLVETAYVLTTVYGLGRARVVDVLSELVQRRNLSLLHVAKPLALQALQLCRGSARVSFGDALTWAQARQAGADRMLTFDRRFPDEGLERIGSKPWKAPRNAD
ncbi:MAG: type II toxin-antitoxin system VapC family toxin [Thermoanaerobaculia bacterium]